MHLTPNTVGRILLCSHALGLIFYTITKPASNFMFIVIITIGIVGMILSSWEGDKGEKWNVKYMLLLIPIIGMSIFSLWLVS
jgi:hypothetical protein